VVDVIVQVGRQGNEQCDVVGYEIESAGAESTQAARMLIPLPDTLAASGEHLIVPASAIKFVRALGDISDEYDTVNEDKIDRRLRRGVSSTD
jgi:hypothetical protein